MPNSGPFAIVASSFWHLLSAQLPRPFMPGMETYQGIFRVITGLWYELDMSVLAFSELDRLVSLGQRRTRQ
jgi:hypothetical protein